MSFYDLLCQYRNFDFHDFWDKMDSNDVERSLQKDILDVYDYLVLLAPAAEQYLEEMAQRSHKLTVQHFGRTIQLYTPLYLSNYCVNQCSYCSFNAKNKLHRKTLSPKELEEEGMAIAAAGLQHLLVLTGESRHHAPIAYLKDAIAVLAKHFAAVGIEVYPLEIADYAELIAGGADSLTIYQETYLEHTYERVHLKGPKRNFRYRLEAPERGCKAGIRAVNIGALLGLGSDWRQDAFYTGLHAGYLQHAFWDVEISVSLPRIRPHAGQFAGESTVNDKNLVQNLLALRLFLPRVGITISTRESAAMRDNLLPLGITKMSAGSSTEVGGRTTEDKGDGQFEIDDSRTVQEIRANLLARGYQPVFKDWHPLAEAGSIFSGKADFNDTPGAGSVHGQGRF